MLNRYYISMLCSLIILSDVGSNAKNQPIENDVEILGNESTQDTKPRRDTEDTGPSATEPSLISQKVKLTVFYEAMCPYSVEFINSQLVPTFKTYKDFIYLDLVPFGFAKEFYENGVLQFKCEHGSKECSANLIHACAIYIYQSRNNSRLLMFIECLTSSGNQLKASLRCSQTARLDFLLIQLCSQSEKGKEILSGFGNRTHAFNPKLKNFPAVVFNSVFNSDDNEVAYKSLDKVICKSVPETCSLP